MLRTWGLEVDASHLHRVCWMMGHHFCVAQEALGSRFGILALAAQTQASQRAISAAKNARRENKNTLVTRI